MRLRTVVDAARDYAEARSAWIEQRKRGEPVDPTDEITHRQAATGATLLLRVRLLDEGRVSAGG